MDGKSNPQTGNPDRLLNALSSLNQIGATVNKLGPSQSITVEGTLRLIVESAIKVIHDSSAVIYTYSGSQQRFKRSSRVSAGEKSLPDPHDEPRRDGMGHLAIARQQRVVSYEEQEVDIHPIKTEAGARAVTCYPLIVAGQIVGVLYVYLHEMRKFEQLELLMLDNFVNQAAMAIFHARRIVRARRRLAEKEDEVTSLRRAGLLISSRSGLQETLDSILQMAMDVIGAEYGSFRLVSEHASVLELAAIAGDPPSPEAQFDLPIDETSIMGRVAKRRQPLLVDDVLDEKWSQIYYPLNESTQMRSELAVPLIGASGRLEGVLNLESPQPDAFNEEDIRRLHTFATHAVIAIQEMVLLNALQEISEILLSESQPRVLQRVASLACSLLNACSSSIWMLTGEQLDLKAAAGDDTYHDAIAVRGSIIGQVVQSGMALTSTDSINAPAMRTSEAGDAEASKHLLVVPLQREAGEGPDALGAISVCLDASGGVETSDWDQKVLTILAHYASLTIRNTARIRALEVARSQRAATETFAALGDIAVNLLHQLNNRIGIIPVRIQGIQESCTDAIQADPYLEKNLAVIEAKAREAMIELRDSLTLLHPVNPAHLHLHECVAEALEKSNLHEMVKFESDIFEAFPPLFASKPGIVLIFVNLLENAAQAMNKQGTIRLSGQAEKDAILITVADDGPGIDPAVHDEIFELTYSGNDSLKGGKLGFGLWWVRMLMVRLGGSVSVESDGLKGTRFHLRFPMPVADEGAEL